MAENNKINYNIPSVGTLLKIAVSAEIGNDMHLEDVDFECYFHKEGFEKKGQQVLKDDMIRIDADTYIAIVDTKLIGVGNYYCLLTVQVPDNDVEGGLRTEAVRFPTYIRVNK